MFEGIGSAKNMRPSYISVNGASFGSHGGTATGIGLDQKTQVLRRLTSHRCILPFRNTKVHWRACVRLSVHTQASNTSIVTMAVGFWTGPDSLNHVIGS